MKYAITNPAGRTYMSVWQEDGKSLLMQLYSTQPYPMIRLDIKALPQLIERLIDTYNEIHPGVLEAKQKDDGIVSEGSDQPTTNLGEAW